jgi:hypothetical protein
MGLTQKLGTIPLAIFTDASNNVGIGITPTTRLTIGRVDSSSEGAQIDLCRASDNTNAWGIDIFGNTSTPSFRILDNVAGAARMIIDGTGRVGFGLSPTYALDVANSSSPSLRVRNGALGGTSTLLLETANNFSGTCQTFIQCIGSVGNGTSQLAFGTAGASGDATATERMRITSGGGVVAGSTLANPTGLEDGWWLKQASNARAYFSSSGATALACNRYGSTGSLITFDYAGSGIGTGITTNGSTISYNTSSDYRLKEDFKEVNGLEKVSAIKVYNFRFIGTENIMDGVIAHELSEVLPYAVTGEKDAVDEDGKILSQGVDYSLIVPVLVKAIQELNAKVSALENKS